MDSQELLWDQLRVGGLASPAQGLEARGRSLRKPLPVRVRRMQQEAEGGLECYSLKPLLSQVQVCPWNLPPLQKWGGQGNSLSEGDHPLVGDSLP